MEYLCDKNWQIIFLNMIACELMHMQLSLRENSGF